MKTLLSLSYFLILTVLISVKCSFANIPANTAADTLEIKTLSYFAATQDSTAAIRILYPEVSGLNDKRIEDKINQQLESDFKQSIEWYEEIISDSTLSEEMPYQFTYTFDTGFEVMYNSKSFISIVMSHYQFTGGAHGNFFAIGYNIKTSSGELLKLKDIIKDGSYNILSYECEQIILEKYEAGSLLEAGLFEDEINITKDQDFYVTPGYLVLQFDPYEIGPYAMGEITAEIPFERITDILKPNLPFPIK